MAGQLTGTVAAGRDPLGEALAELREAATVLRAAGLLRQASAFERKAADPREDLDKLLHVKLRRGQRYTAPDQAARTASADQALLSLAAGHAETPWHQAAAVRQLLAAADPAAVRLFREHALPTSQERLAKRLKRACVYREAAADASSAIVRE